MQMLEWIISSSVLTVVIIGLRYILKGKIGLRLQYALWSLVLLRLLVPVSFGGSGISVMNAVREAPAIGGTAAVSGPGVVDLMPGDTYPADTPGGLSGGYSGGVSNLNPPAVTGDNATAPKAASPSAEKVLTWIWISGAFFMAAAHIISNALFSRRLRIARRPLAGKSAPLPVYVSEEVDTPCLYGFFRPKIYVTPEAAGDKTALGHVLEHETTHFRHGDHIWSVLRCLCLCLHWYNPLVWLAAVLSRRDAELSCDEGTLRRIGEDGRGEYGRTLIAMTCRKPAALLITATTMTGSKRGIKERISLIAKGPKTAALTLIAVLLIAAVAAGCTFTGAKDNTGESSENVTLYDCDGIAVALPNEYIDKLIVRTGDELYDGSTLISVYEKASVEAAEADGYGENDGFGWLFSLVRYDRVRYERYLSSGGVGLSFFAADDKWYYGWGFATDVRYYRSGDEYGDEASLAQWNELNEIGPSLPEDIVARNSLEPYSDNEIRSGYTYGGEHRFLNYYPYFSVNGSKEEIFVLVLSQPAKQGEGGIWCVERMLYGEGAVNLWFPESGKPAAEYYAELQAECDAGRRTDLLDIEASATDFLSESGYFNSKIIDGSFEQVSAPGGGTVQSAAVSAVYNYMDTGWWSGTAMPEAEYVTAAFSELYREEADGALILYGVSLYRGYIRDGDAFTPSRDFMCECIITLDASTLSVKDFWVPGDGAYHDMDIYERFPEDVANMLLTDEGYYDRYYTTLSLECDARAEAYFSSKAYAVGRYGFSGEISDIFDSGMNVTLYVANYGACNTYLVTNNWYARRFAVILSGNVWARLEAPSTEPSDFWITISAADGSKSMTLWSSGGSDMIQYYDGENTFYRVANPESGAYILDSIRHEYDNLDMDYRRISFYVSGGAEEAADTFVHSVYGSHIMNLAPGNMYGVDKYEVINWGVIDYAEGKAVVGWFTYAVIPWDFDSSGIWAGNTEEGTGEYEGWLTMGREFVLEKQADGYWKCTDLGTGGASLPE